MLVKTLVLLQVEHKQMERSEEAEVGMDPKVIKEDHKNQLMLLQKAQNQQ